MKKIWALFLAAFCCLIWMAFGCAETDGRYTVTNPANAETEERFSVFMNNVKELLARYPSETLTEAEAETVIAALREKGYEVEYVFEQDETIYRYDFASDLCVSLFGNRIANWPVRSKADFDQAMVELGELEYCHNLIPEKDEISEDEAVRLAIAYIETYYEQPEEAAITLNYEPQEENHQAGYWGLGVETKWVTYSVSIKNRKVSCRAHGWIDTDLETYYVSLTDERGAFFKWTIEEKAEFAARLPELMARAEENGEIVPSGAELRAIAEYGFCEPTENAIGQAEAYEIAVKAVSEKFGAEELNIRFGEAYYSFFVSEENGATWRVMFRNVDDENFHNGLVDLNAETGEVIRAEDMPVKESDFIAELQDHQGIVSSAFAILTDRDFRFVLTREDGVNILRCYRVDSSPYELLFETETAIPQTENELQIEVETGYTDFITGESYDFPVLMIAQEDEESEYVEQIICYRYESGDKWTFMRSWGYAEYGNILIQEGCVEYYEDPETDQVIFSEPLDFDADLRNFDLQILVTRNSEILETYLEPDDYMDLHG